MTWVKTDRAAKHLMVMLELPSCQSLSFREPDKWIRIAAAFSGFVTVWIPRFEARHGGRVLPWNCRAGILNPISAFRSFHDTEEASIDRVELLQAQSRAVE